MSNSSYSYNDTQIVEADVNSEYEFIFRISDYFTHAEKSLNLGTSFTLVDYNASGRGIAIGRVSSEDCFQVAMDIKQEHYFNGRRCQYVPETASASNIGWFLVLHGENVEQYENYSCLLAVTQIHSRGGNQASGIISLNVRINDYVMSVAD